MPDHHVGHVVLTDLVKRYENTDPTARPAVGGVSLDVRAGEFLTLLGPSGCGKTTTLRMVAGFETPTSGTIELDGADMLRLPPNKRPMAMVFQSYALFPHLSVFENVAYGLRIDRTRRGRLEESVEIALTSMNLTGLGERFPHQLSGGQQQRVALARAMVMQPSVLLFDEPLSNLDAKFREQMRREIRLLQRRMGITSLYVTHDQAEAMSLSDRIVVMNAGKIEQVATPTEVYTRPASVFVGNFIGRATFLPVPEVAVRDGRGCVRVFGQEASVATHPGLGSGGVLMVRPESVSVTPTSEGGTGIVRSVVYLGSGVDYEVETDHGTVLASVADPNVDQLLEEGTKVAVEFDPTRAYLLPRS
ncbi:ABC transporter ATP-binding protein [Umezawaea endophytica]|uniref:ABC transporter ATP-binding protein n=1 Tax=Umezawaea endophytica TaxID=1654476 RepID=A0A9X3AGG9_9PSEU|nr:ABC transporter ATP-binding protein [Umezawaea endophytica]MCS7480107.1 ABC transporter ATP-binding protein [Umezawaea endophytica]